MPAKPEPPQEEFTPHPTTGAPSVICHYECPKCKAEIHINAPVGGYSLTCGACGTVSPVVVGTADQVLTPTATREG